MPVVRHEWMEDVDLDPPAPCRSNASPACTGNLKEIPDHSETTA